MVLLARRDAAGCHPGSSCLGLAPSAGEAVAGEPSRARLAPSRGGVGRFAGDPPAWRPRQRGTPPPGRIGNRCVRAARRWRHARWALAGGRRGRTPPPALGRLLLTFGRVLAFICRNLGAVHGAVACRTPPPTRRAPAPPRSPSPPLACAGGARRPCSPSPWSCHLLPRPHPPFPSPFPPRFVAPPTPPAPFMSSPIPVLAPTVSAPASSAAAAAVGVAALAASSSHAARPQFRRTGGHPGRAPSLPSRRPPGGGVGLPGLPPAAAAQLAAFAAALGGFFPPVVAAAKGFGASRRPGGGGAAAAGGGFGIPAGSHRAGAPRASKGSGGKLRPCEPCGGTGLKRCAFCRGGGVMIGYLGASVPCVPCEQKGTMGRPCPDCGGMGFFQ